MLIISLRVTLVGKTHGRGPVQSRALGVERRLVHGLVACAAGPGGVAAAVTEASRMAYQHLVRAEYVPSGAAGGWLDNHGACRVDESGWGQPHVALVLTHDQP
jgi:hypothetical protein